MHITISAEKLLNYLSVVQKGLPGRTTMEIIKGIYMETDNNSLIINSNNLEMSIKALIEEVDTLKDGKVVLPPKFIDILKQLTQNEVEIIMNDEDFKIEIKGGSSNFLLYGMNAEEFPRFSEKSEWSNWNNINFSASEFKKILQHVAFAVSHDEGKPLFKAVYIEIDETGNLTFTASDTYRLARYKKLLQSPFEPLGILIPGKTLNELSKTLDYSSEEVKCFFEQKEMIFVFKGFEFSTRLLEDKYPDFSSIFPASYNTKIKVNRVELEKMLHRASLVAQGINQMVCIEIENNILKVSAGSDVGKMEEELQLKEKEGEDLEGIYLNARFLIEPMRILEEDILDINFNGPLGPCIFNINNESEEYRYLVLPIKSSY